MEQTRQSEGPTATAEPGRAEPRTKRVVPKKPVRRAGTAVSDPVGDMLTRIRNAVGARHENVEIPASGIKAEIAKILKAEGYIADIQTGEKVLTLRLKYQGRDPALRGADRVSRPGRRAYASRDELPLVLGGLGVVIVSTSAGVMTGRDARRKGLGGEILAKVW